MERSTATWQNIGWQKNTRVEELLWDGSGQGVPVAVHPQRKGTASSACRWSLLPSPPHPQPPLTLPAMSAGSPWLLQATTGSIDSCRWLPCPPPPPPGLTVLLLPAKARYAPAPQPPGARGMHGVYPIGKRHCQGQLFLERSHWYLAQTEAKTEGEKETWKNK